jgi:YVTN family beta-propeller protein
LDQIPWLQIGGINAVAYYKGSTKIYVANSQSNTVSVIDSNNDTVIKTVKVGANPYQIAIGRLPPLYVAYVAYKVYVANKGANTVSVIDPFSNFNKKNVTVGAAPSSMLYEERNKIYVANSNSSTVSIINGYSDTVKQIPVGNTKSTGIGNPGLTFAGDKKIYVANVGSNTISVINPSKDIIEQNISLGFYSPEGIVGDLYSHKIYVTNPDSNTVSVIDGSKISGMRDKKEPSDIAVGQEPGPISFNAVTHMIYVGNMGSNSLSVINGFTSKVAAGVTFNVHPIYSGTIWCGNRQYPTGTHMYVDNGTSCIGQGKNNFVFDGWVQNLGGNSSLPASDSSNNLTIDRYGTFTANFKPLPPAIPQEFLYLLVGIILSSLFGWSIPSIAGWVKARNQLKHLKECINQIGKLDKNAIEEKIIGYYVDGKINEDHRQLLKDKISEYYENVKGSSALHG